MPAPRRRTLLAAALGLRGAGVYAFVGAGGKTSAIRRLLGERPQALATTTTHLSRSGFGVGLLVAAPGGPALRRLEAHARGVRPLTLARGTGGARLAAPSLEWQHEFFGRHRRDLVLVEADGARRRRLKLPAAHEPAWPPAALAGAVVVVGAAALGAPADLACHRPSAFAAAGLRGARVTERHLHVMVERYLQRLPPQGPVAVLITGIRSPDMALVQRLVRHVLLQVRRRDPRFQSPYVPVRVVATPDLASGPFWTWGFGAVREDRRIELPGVCGILLAAGRGERFGRSGKCVSKLLVRWRGQALVEHSGRHWRAAGFAQLVAVTGHAPAPVEAGLRRGASSPRAPQLVLARNRAHARGLGTSVRAAARRVPDGMGLLFGHADMPRLTPAILRRIARLGTSLREWIVIPTVAEKPVNPVYFPASLRGALLRVADAGGGKPVIAAHRDRVFYLAVDDVAREFVDVDRPGDLRRLG